MRISSLFLLAALGTTACKKQEPQPGSATADREKTATAPAPKTVITHLPKNSALVIRFRSVERADAIAEHIRKELAELELDVPPLSTLLRRKGVKPEAVDPAQPVCFVETDPEARQTIVLARPAAGAEEATTRRNVSAEVRDGVLVAGTAKQLAAESRGTPLTTLDGDVVLHIELGDFIAKRKAEIDGTVAQFRARALSARGVPSTFRDLALSLAAHLHEAVFAVESFAYALTWQDGNALGEGLIQTQPGTPLHGFLKRAGPPGATDAMVGYLPHDALITFDYAGAPDWPTREFQALVDGALGPGSGAALGAVLDPTVLMADHLTGRVAGSLRLLGLGFGATSIAELRDGVDAAAVLEKIDVEAINAALKKANVPVTVNFEKAFIRDGETELHRLTIQAAAPALAMAFGATQTILAVEGRHLFLCVSPTAADDMSALLGRVRAGDPPRHPHAEAMARLGPTHNVGLTFNVGAVKPLAMLLGMTAPDVGTMLSKLPDELRLSTALTFADGDVHWRGDWPLEAIADAVRAVQGPRRAPKARKDEAFK